MTPARVVILHGYTADPGKHWFPWVAGELSAEGIRVEVPALPEPQQPDPEAWLAAATEAIGRPDDRTVVVGHSLGCITALRALAGRDDDWCLAGAVLVSGFDRALTTIPEIDAFTVDPLDCARLAPRIRRRWVIASDDDVIVDPGHSAALARRLDADLVTVPGGGHFLDREGWTRLPQVVERIRVALG